MKQIIFDYLCDRADVHDDDAWPAHQFIFDNFDYQEIYNQIDNLFDAYLAQKQ